MSLLAGESVGQTKRLMSAAGIIDEMMSGAESGRLGSMVADHPPGLRGTSHERHRGR